MKNNRNNTLTEKLAAVAAEHFARETPFAVRRAVLDTLTEAEVIEWFSSRIAQVQAIDTQGGYGTLSLYAGGFKTHDPLSFHGYIEQDVSADGQTVAEVCAILAQKLAAKRAKEDETQAAFVAAIPESVETGAEEI